MVLPSGALSTLWCETDCNIMRHVNIGVWSGHDGSGFNQHCARLCYFFYVKKNKLLKNSFYDIYCRIVYLFSPTTWYNVRSDLKMLGLYLDTLIIAHKFCSIISILNEYS